eukprot:4620871-Alexandrium_andersonii.AAC.1
MAMWTGSRGGPLTGPSPASWSSWPGHLAPGAEAGLGRLPSGGRLQSRRPGLCRSMGTRLRS